MEEFDAPALRPHPKERFKISREQWIEIAAKLTAVFGTGAVPKESAG